MGGGSSRELLRAEGVGVEVAQVGGVKKPPNVS
jgi:hypothetical protein